jgi:hypothetical protein
MTTHLIAKSLEVETAVDDLLATIVSFPLDGHIKPVAEGEILKLKAHYNWSMYQALLNATKASLFSLKKRLQGRRSPNPNEAEPVPFFEVSNQMDGVSVRLYPSIDDVQGAINRAALAVIRCSKNVRAWDTNALPRSVVIALKGPEALPPGSGQGGAGSPNPNQRKQGSFYDRVAQVRLWLHRGLLGECQCMFVPWRACK